MLTFGRFLGRAGFALLRALIWLWPTILSLDAPAVALVWQALLARVIGLSLATHHVGLLGLSVWLAYATERWIEGWRLAVIVNVRACGGSFCRSLVPISVITLRAFESLTCQDNAGMWGLFPDGSKPIAISSRTGLQRCTGGRHHNLSALQA